MSKYNFQVRVSPKKQSKDTQVENDKLVKRFLRKWKKSGILRELKEKSVPITAGQKARRKKYLGKRRNRNKKI